MPAAPLAKRRLERLDYLLFGVLLLAAIPTLYLGATERIEYDGYWHIFTAQQDRWHNFMWDCHNDAHPPLYYLALRLTLWLGKSLLAYRAVTIISGLASIAVMGRSASKTMRSTLTPVLVALAYGLALPTIVIACEVRSYMLCSLFLLAAYAFFLDTIEHPGPSGSLRPRVYFALVAALACPADYYAVFFVATTFGIALVLPILRRKEPLWRAWAREIATFTPVFGVMAWLYFWHLSKHPVLQEHMLTHYYDSTGQESLGEFLLRNLQNTFNLFSPWPITGLTAFLAVSGGLLAAVCGTLWMARRLWERKNLAVTVTVVATVLMLAEIMVASLVRLYPFGGFLRQQFILFPFLILCAFFLVDGLAAAIPRRAAYAMAGVLSLGIVAMSAWAFDRYPKIGEPLFTEQVQRFNRLFPDPAAVYVDQFNIVAFFLPHHDWKWKFLGRVPSFPNVDIYRVSHENRSLLVFRDKARWIADAQDATLYRALAVSMRSKSVPSITLFRLAQDEGQPWEAGEMKAYRTTIAELAGESGLCVQALSTHDRDVFAEFRAGGCTAPPERAAP